jgi:N,N'-diacetyllegionaminate synthase|tara:strand:+ start:957 stop:1964 length:1008 start_codon:yes stop_codon:yes gene_type:complete
MKRTLIIAEAGVNHNGSVEIARKLIAEAANAGADLIKFQSFLASESISKTAPKAQYQIETTGASESQYEMVKKLELSREDHVLLLEECNQHGIGFFSTAFDKQSFDLLDSLGCLELIKIPSGELTNLPLLRYMVRLGKPVLLSTGMATLGEIEAAIDVIIQSGTARELITVLHCTTEYPAPMNEVNLLAMKTMSRAFGLDVGYSDHTQGIEVAIAAVAIGAVVIEKHFTLSRAMSGPDHGASLEPKELKKMVGSIRNIEIAIGDGIKKPTPSELNNKLVARKSIVARCTIQCGEAFTKENLATKRPGTGITPMLWDEVLGKLAIRNFSTDEAIEL